MIPLPRHWQTHRHGYAAFCLGDGDECEAEADDRLTIAEVDVWMATHRAHSGHARFHVSTFGTADLCENEPPLRLPTATPALQLLATTALTHINHLWTHHYTRTLAHLNQRTPRRTGSRRSGR
ncbi:hypothetical protein [Streptomyces zagrosensis]|uniref:Uncharacterized protein n=1 Tax=Streptomyces zagrosensis TaxID=1042984 RepID=A0A7W9Q7V9_9ACTN|nr:hypothetical protein [Streptomyces zagrosensis]MBB5935231.1 hypothetical protein [Streptomyces zagrosensis]